MKKLLSILLCVLLLGGCAATYDGPTETKYALTEYVVDHRYTGIFDSHEYTDRWLYAYDIYGNRVREMEYRDGELRSVTNMKYDDRGNLISQKSWDHTKWIPLPDRGRKHTYDDQGRVLTTVYLDGWGRETSRSTYTYDDEANTYTWESDDGTQSLYYLDENGNELRVVGNYGAETVYEYDDRGNRTGWVGYQDGVRADSYQARYDDQDRQIWGGRYSAAGELESETLWEYDDEANTITTRRPDGHIRIEYRDGDGRLHMIEDYDTEGELTMVQQYYYQEIQVPANREE